MKMDFTTVAMARPDIVDRTFDSFSKNLRKINLRDCRLIINIDPLPEGNKRKEVVKVANKYFGEVIHNYPEKANFSAACNWVWSHADTTCIFHLEDDWVLKEPVNVRELLTFFEQHIKLQVVQLRAYRFTYNKIALSPCIMHKKLYQAMGGNLVENINPEVQMRGEKFGIIMPYPTKKLTHKGKIITYPKDKKRIILKDIGRSWIKKTEYTKQKVKKARFVTWEKK